MKAVSILCVLVLALTARCFAQIGFQNLDFEAAQVPDVPAGHLGGVTTPSQAIPGWSTQNFLSHNDVSLGGAAVILYGPFWLGGEILAGKYSVSITTSFGSPQIQPAWIAQTGQIPSTAKSVTFLAAVSSTFELSFGGTVIPWSVLSASGGSEFIGADISHFANQTGELRFSALPRVGATGGGLILDNIQFSSQAVPEPDSLALALLGVFVLWRHKIKRT